jgi:hypothetical protein
MVDSEESLLRRRLAGIMHDTVTANRVALEVNGLLRLLIASDAIGKASITRARTGSARRPPDDGQAQMAFVLYWITHEPVIFATYLERMPEMARKVWGVLADVARTFHPTTISTADYAWVRAKPGGVVASDGSIVGSGVYQDLDVGWLWALFNYLFNVVEPSRVAPFTPPDAHRTSVPYNKPLQIAEGHARIALVGDWGTGPFDAGGYYPSTSVMKSVAELAPSYIVHLGDVYYAGTQNAPQPGEEMHHFLETWPKMPEERSFTLNSNHEMYGGANGYFNVALGRGAKMGTPFAHQNGYSYFALTSADLAIVGLDTAYFDPSPMYMHGGLGSPGENPQYDFLTDVASRHARLILLTHQPPMSADGTKLSQLWTDVTRVVPSSKIRLWYWGHVHLGILYGDQSKLGARGIRAGCSGHGAIPIGVPWGLKHGNGKIDWYASTPVGGSADAERVRNGFAMLTISDGQVGEAFYDAGDSGPTRQRHSITR